jgi:hypothetical protein
MSSVKKFYGKYRGTVINNLDPEQLGRIQAIVPAVSNVIPTSWAMPCVPLAGKQEGTFMVPQIGAGVWMEFEEGDPDKPIWVGGFWGSVAEVPTSALTPPIPPGQNIVIQTTMQNTLMISDAAPAPVPAPIPAPSPIPTGGITLRSPTGAMIVVNDAGIFIHNGKGASIEMLGPTVMINKVALVIT